MKVDVEKLTQILHEIYGDVDSKGTTSAVCILDAKDIEGNPMQIQLLATNDIDEFIASDGYGYKAIEI